ncbi:MAG: hypothetical protein FWJ93_04195 [Micromonosporaceae bacterium]
MNGYTITIVPDDGQHASTTVRLDVDAGAVRITEVNIRAGKDGNLSPRQMPAIDLDLLMRAVAPVSVLPAITATAESPAPAAESQESSAPSAPQPTTAVAHDVPEEETAPETVADTTAAGTSAIGTGTPNGAVASRAKSTRATAARASGTPAKAAGAKRTRAKATGTAPARVKATAAKATAAKATRKATAAKATRTSTTARRAYRRMPEDIVAVFRRTGSVTATARHYGVPRHTAQGWVGRLRKQQLLPERG